MFARELPPMQISPRQSVAADMKLAGHSRGCSWMRAGPPWRLSRVYSSLHSH
jgi:hypothetical protein